MQNISETRHITTQIRHFSSVAPQAAPSFFLLGVKTSIIYAGVTPLGLVMEGFSAALEHTCLMPPYANYNQTTNYCRMREPYGSDRVAILLLFQSPFRYPKKIQN